MKVIVVSILFGLAGAVQYSELKDVINKSPTRTIRLTEIEAAVNSQGPMDQVGSLCYQQLRDISLELSELDRTHNKFVEHCKSMSTEYATTINTLSLDVANANKDSSAVSVKWNLRLPEIPPIKVQRDKLLAEINKLEGDVITRSKQRAAIKANYDRDMVDFARSLADLDAIRKVIANSSLGDQTTSSGFLEVVNNVQSDYFRAQTNRLTRAANLLEEVTTEGQPSGVDKVNTLIINIRNEMLAQMDKLTVTENNSIKTYKSWLLSTRSEINKRYVQRANRYIQIGNVLQDVGVLMLQESELRVTSATLSKKVDQTQIQKDFLEADCNAEPAMYAKSRMVKLAEIETIEQMLKILSNLNWSGAVYSAIARIGGSGAVDANPEPGYVLGFQMDITNGLPVFNYDIQNKDTKDFGRVAIQLRLGTEWVWASFDAYSGTLDRYLMPSKTNGFTEQRMINNLHVLKSPSGKVLTQDNAAQGNLEIWADEYSTKNFLKIPEASDGTYDFGDQRSVDPNGKKWYGCFQVHDHVQKQTVLAVNRFTHGTDAYDLGIGNQPQPAGSALVHPDWTFSQNFKTKKARGDRMEISWFFQPKGYGAKST